MMGADNRAGPSEGPVAGRACRDPGRRRGRGPCVPTRGGRFGHGSGASAWMARQRGGDSECGSSTARGSALRVRENRMHGVGGGGRKRDDDAQPYTARWVVYRWRASRLPHTPILRTRPQAGRVERNSEHEPQESEQRTRADPPLGPPSLSKQQVAGWRVILWTPQRQSGRSPLALLNLPVRPRRPDRH